MEFDILGVNLKDLYLKEDEERHDNTQDPGKMHQNGC